MQRHAKHEGRSALKPSIANQCTVQQQQTVRSGAVRLGPAVTSNRRSTARSWRDQRPRTRPSCASLPHPQMAASAATLDRPWRLEKQGIDPDLLLKRVANPYQRRRGRHDSRVERPFVTLDAMAGLEQPHLRGAEGNLVQPGFAGQPGDHLSRAHVRLPMNRTRSSCWMSTCVTFCESIKRRILAGSNGVFPHGMTVFAYRVPGENSG